MGLFDFPTAPEESPEDVKRKKILTELFSAIILGSILAIGVLYVAQRGYFIEDKHEIADTVDLHVKDLLVRRLEERPRSLAIDLISICQRERRFSREERETLHAQCEGRVEDLRQAILQRDESKIKVSRDALVSWTVDLLKSRSLLIKNADYVAAWCVASVFYLLVIGSVYRGRLQLSIGEPIFNVMDVAVISILVGFTGGVFSPAQLLYVVSIFLATYDFVVFKSWTRIVPYGFILLFHYFWAVFDNFLKHEVRWHHIALMVLLPLLGIAIAYCIAKYFEPYVLHKGGTPA